MHRLGANEMKKSARLLSVAIGLAACLLNAALAFGQNSFDPTLTDRKSLVVDLPQFKIPNLNEISLSDTLSVYSRVDASGYKASTIYAEYDISGLNPEGIFGARVSGTFLSELPPGGATRRINSRYYSNDGIVQPIDTMSHFIQDRPLSASDEPYIDVPGGASSAVFDKRVDGVVREIISNGGTHFGVSFTGDFSVPMNMSPTDAPTLHITEYYANPFDGLQKIAGDNGLSFRGHAADLLTRGDSLLISPEGKTFLAELGPQNSLTVTIRDDVIGSTWSLRMSSPDGSLLKAGDVFDAERNANSSTGVGGLDFKLNGFGYFNPKAWFEINDILYGSNGELLKLDALFKTSEPFDTLGDPTLFGHLKYSAVPEPGSLSLLAVTGVAGYLVRRMKKKNAV